MDAIEYAVNERVGVEEFIDVLKRSTLANRRPVHDSECIAGMLRNTNLLVSARSGGRLVGVARSVADFYYCCYLSDLAVDEALQRQGIGKELIRLTRAQL